MGSNGTYDDSLSHVFMDSYLFIIYSMSMGFLVDEKSPVIWRGLMVMSALDKLLRQVDWGVLDYLVIDTPPGTGDTHLSLIQNLPISGALLVSSSQKAALDVTRRGANMFKKLGIPLVGVVENMSIVKCPKCNDPISLFNGDMEKVIKELGMYMKTNLSISMNIKWIKCFCQIHKFYKKFL